MAMMDEKAIHSIMLEVHNRSASLFNRIIGHVSWNVYTPFCALIKGIIFLDRRPAADRLGHHVLIFV